MNSWKYNNVISTLDKKKEEYEYSKYQDISDKLKEFVRASNDINKKLYSARQQMVVDYCLCSACDKIISLSRTLSILSIPWTIANKIESIADIAQHIKLEAWSKFSDYQLQSAINDLSSKQMEIENYLMNSQREMRDIDSRKSIVQQLISELERKYTELQNTESEIRSLGFGNDMMGFRMTELRNKFDRINHEIRDIENSISREEQFYVFVHKPM